MNFRKNYKEDPEINLIPLIDVLLVILIFLMITTTYSKYAELQINLPSADAEKRPDRPNEINIAITAAGQYIVNKQTIVFRDIQGFSDELRKVGSNMKDPIVIINGDAKSDLQATVNIMEAARLAGYSQVSISTQTAK